MRATALTPVAGQPQKARRYGILRSATKDETQGGHKWETLDQVEVWWTHEPEPRHHLTAAEFWASLRTKHSYTIILADPIRELALLGDIPADWTHHRPPLHHRNFYLQHLKRGRYSLDLYGLGNLHPCGIYGATIDIEDAAAWLTAWITICQQELGWVQASPGAQGVWAYRRTLHTDPDPDPLRYHNNHDLHRFEYQTKCSQAPVRITAPDGIYHDVWALDYTAHYLHVLATDPLPVQPIGWNPTGCTPQALKWGIAKGLGAIAHVTTPTGQQWLTTPDVATTEIAEVHQAAWYRLGHPLAHFAHRMFELRETCPAIIKPTMKATCVATWGKLAQRSHRTTPATADYEPGQEYLWGTTVMPHRDPLGLIEHWTDEGQLSICDPAAYVPGRFHALGAHILAHGRRRLMDLINTCGSVLASHTDSLWTQQPPPGHIVHGRKSGKVLGQLVGIKYGTVEWADGVRYVNGEVDAAPGVARQGTRRYLESWRPGHARYEVRR